MTAESNTAEEAAASSAIVPREQPDSRASVLIDGISASSFDDWYREREFARNIREGKPYFNGPDRVPPPERHSPSQLNQCHRKIYYRQLNAPEEQADPQGIFWTGTNFEEELVVPYLESLVGPDEYVRNSMWVDITCETDAGEVRIKGATDPVIVDNESEPLLLTESKTKSSIEHLTEPDTHHRAQAHAYMYGLTEQYDRRVTDTMLIYGSRNSLDLRAFHVPFDPWFWRETVLSWAGEHTQYRLDETLPSDTPAFDWECNFCDFKHRCGQANKTHAVDTDPEGFLPLFDGYPRTKIVDYLDANPGAKLTPTLARRYPSLAESYGVYEWHCEVCRTDYSVESTDWDGDIDDPPQCDSCADQQVFASLAGPAPEAQTIERGEG